MINFSFDNIGGFSRLFLDFIENKPDILKRFPSNKNQQELINKLSGGKYNRAGLKATIENSMDGLINDKMAIANIKLIEEKNTFFVVTGQQIGLFGGPLYILLKIRTAINKANNLNKIYPGYNFIPLFWIEDNDHDQREASKAYFTDIDYKLIELSVPLSIEGDITSDINFDESITEQIEIIKSEIQSTTYTEELIQLLNSIYQPNRSWLEAFSHLMAEIFKGTGLLLLSASIARKNSMFNEPVKKELNNIGKTRKLVEKGNAELEKLNYHIQAKIKDLNLFLHEKESRFRIEVDNNGLVSNGKSFSFDDLNELAENSENFSPQVLLRPLFQDYAIPTVMYVAGPSEIGYLAQTKELYFYFELPMPVIQPRISATFVDKTSSRAMEKENLSILYFLREFQLIERELKTELMEEEHSTIFSEAKTRLYSLYNSILYEIVKVDKNLENTLKGNLQKSINLLENIEKKTASATKKKHEILFERYIRVSNFLYPKGSLQERFLCPLNIINLCGMQGLRDILKKMENLEGGKHYQVELF